MFSVSLCGPSKGTLRCYTSICDGIIEIDIQSMTFCWCLLTYIFQTTSTSKHEGSHTFFWFSWLPTTNIWTPKYIIQFVCSCQKTLILYYSDIPKWVSILPSLVHSEVCRVDRWIESGWYSAKHAFKTGVYKFNGGLNTFLPKSSTIIFGTYRLSKNLECLNWPRAEQSFIWVHCCCCLMYCDSRCCLYVVFWSSFSPVCPNHIHPCLLYSLSRE